MLFLKEKFCQIKDFLSLYKKIDYLKLHCFSCSSNTHLFTECPLIHYIPNRIGILQRHTASENQNREVYSRKNFKFHVLSNLKIIISKALLISRSRRTQTNDSQMFDSDILNENNELEGDSDKEKSESGRKGSSRKKSSFEFYRPIPNAQTI